MGVCFLWATMVEVTGRGEKDPGLGLGRWLEVDWVLA